VILERLLQTHAPRLSAADHKIADTLLAHPRETALLSTNELAQRAEVHPTSAVRFARKLGFGGYPALRTALQTELFNESAAADRVRRRIERLGRGRRLEAFVQSEIRALARLPEQVSDRKVEAAARAIVGARKVFLFGIGHAENLARLMQLRLTRGGYAALMLHGEPREIAATMLQARRNDVFVLFSFQKVQPRIPRIAAYARSVGARTMLITDIVKTALLPYARPVLAATRGEPGEARSLTVPMAIVNTILLEVSRLDRGRMIEHLERLEKEHARLEEAG